MQKNKVFERGESNDLESNAHVSQVRDVLNIVGSVQELVYVVHVGRSNHG